MQVSGISSEIFRQIETVENDHDATTAAALEAVERRGEMVVRLLEPRAVGRQAAEHVKRFFAMQVSDKTTKPNLVILFSTSLRINLYRRGSGNVRLTFCECSISVYFQTVHGGSCGSLNPETCLV